MPIPFFDRIFKDDGKATAAQFAAWNRKRNDTEIRSRLYLHDSVLKRCQSFQQHDVIATLHTMFGRHEPYRYYCPAIFRLDTLWDEGSDSRFTTMWRRVKIPKKFI